MAWNIDLRQFAKQVEADHKTQMRVVGFALLRKLVELSPRDTGTYANNHHVSFDAPDPRYIEREGGLQSEVQAFFGGDQEAKILNQKNFHTIYLQNNLPYAEYLEYGTDKMAARNVYSLAIQQIKAEYNLV